MGDLTIKKTIGIINEEEYVELRAQQYAYIAALEYLNSDEEEPSIEDLIEQMTDIVLQPTQEEINAANIDYLLMLGGDE